MTKPSIIIIGAGATGLIAGRELSPFFEVKILEAETRTGGRLHSISNQGIVFEGGAEFIHGNLPLTTGFLKEAGIPFVEVKGIMYRKKNGQLIRAEEMTENWDELMIKMKTLKEDMTMQEFLEKNYPGAGNESLRRHVRSHAEGFDLADISRASIKSLYREWKGSNYNTYRIPAGYGALSQYLQQRAEESGAAFFTGAPVKEVEWQEGNVTVHVASGEKYKADKLLVTVAVSVLQQKSSKAYIHFRPNIDLNENAAGNIGYGTVIKVILKFKNTFWSADAGFVLSDEFFPTWWTQLPDKIPVLTGWLGGPAAAAFANERDEDILEKAMASLAAIFDRPVVQLRKELDLSMVFNWGKSEYSMGAYSYDTIQSDAAKRILTMPLSGTVFFAGEALYIGDHPGTVEAALVSGINTSAAIKNSIRFA